MARLVNIANIKLGETSYIANGRKYFKYDYLWAKSHWIAKWIREQGRAPVDDPRDDYSYYGSLKGYKCHAMLVEQLKYICDITGGVCDMRHSSLHDFEGRYVMVIKEGEGSFYSGIVKASGRYILHYILVKQEGLKAGRAVWPWDDIETIKEI